LTETVIEVRNLVKQYGDLKAVDDLSFEVRAGEVFSILGPNGAGKTTTVEIMECIRDPTSGEVSILGMETHKRSRDIIKKIGVLPQRFDAFDLLTVKENIDYFAQMFEHHLDAEDLVRTIALEDKSNQLFRTLSGGMKQRVGVAISMVNDPDIIFLDEPTTGLDPRARREVWEVVKNLREQGKTVILTTHYMEEAEVLSDRVAIMNQGKFMVVDSPKDIIDRYGKESICTIKGGGQAAYDLLSDNGDEVELRDDDVVVHLKSKRHLTQVIMQLEEKDMYYDEILLQRSNLEDVFLALTGRKIQEGVLTDG
jgi:ABC-2 type transport system ATP-binding protein